MIGQAQSENNSEKKDWNEESVPETQDPDPRLNLKTDDEDLDTNAEDFDEVVENEDLDQDVERIAPDEDSEEEKIAMEVANDADAENVDEEIEGEVLDVDEEEDEEITNKFSSDPKPEKDLLTAETNSPFALEEERGKEVPAPEAQWEPLPAPEIVKIPAPETLPWLNDTDKANFRSQWADVQVRFVDDPHVAVEQADALVTTIIDQINRSIANEHDSLVNQWKSRENVSTEELRKNLQQYRVIFKRLLL